MEIERKFLISRLPDALEQYPCVRMEQAYISTDPVIRVRRAGERYILTCKGRGLLSRDELELDLTPDAYTRLLSKADGASVVKDRYRVPLGAYTVELDIFREALAPLMLAEVEFPTEAAAQAFAAPDWFGQEVTYDPAYTNAALSRDGLPDLEQR
ncbi:MAG: CYTH domain-containing protein [Oscillospiraceae bacterium]|nr:CYTH domain-containing protein [Oscillospiraceae bacterium]